MLILHRLWEEHYPIRVTANNHLVVDRVPYVIADKKVALPLRAPTGCPAARLGAVLRVIYPIFTEGHMAASGERLVRDDLCDTALYLARTPSRLLPEVPEALGLLALLLLTDARRPARMDATGELVLLEEQDRSLWN